MPADELVAVEETTDAQLVLRMVGFFGHTTTDEIAASSVFEGRGDLLPRGLVYLLAQRGFLTTRLLPDGGCRDVYRVELTRRGEEWFENAIEEYLTT
ncbi:MAG: hypothetical protein AB7J35_00485 [Dehalococcoidia bacterium]